MTAQEELARIRHERSRYVVRRFVPAVLFSAAVNIATLFVDISKVHWVAAFSGMALAVILYLLKNAAARLYPIGKA